MFFKKGCFVNTTRLSTQAGNRYFIPGFLACNTHRKKRDKIVDNKVVSRVRVTSAVFTTLGQTCCAIAHAGVHLWQKRLWSAGLWRRYRPQVAMPCGILTWPENHDPRMRSVPHGSQHVRDRGAVMRKERLRAARAGIDRVPEKVRGCERKARWRPSPACTLRVLSHDRSHG